MAEAAAATAAATHRAMRTTEAATATLATAEADTAAAAVTAAIIDATIVTTSIDETTGEMTRETDLRPDHALTVLRRMLIRTTRSNQPHHTKQEDTEPHHTQPHTATIVHAHLLQPREGTVHLQVRMAHTPRPRLHTPPQPRPLIPMALHTPVPARRLLHEDTRHTGLHRPRRRDTERRRPQHTRLREPRTEPPQHMEHHRNHTDREGEEKQRRERENERP